MERLTVYTAEAERDRHGNFIWEVGPFYADTEVHVIHGARPGADLSDDTVLECFAETDTELEG